jgi:hypothetical protein
VHLFLSYASENRPRAEEIALALKADGQVTIFEPKGNAAAEVAAHVNRLTRRRRPLVWIVVAAMLVTLAVWLGMWIFSQTETVGKQFVSKIAESDFVSEAKGDTLGPGQQRQIQLIYRSAPGWEGKETTPGMIHFRISGLLPVVRATWSFRPLATAA